jgi:hypothetical protein
MLQIDVDGGTIRANASALDVGVNSIVVVSVALDVGVVAEPAMSRIHPILLRELLCPITCLRWPTQCRIGSWTTAPTVRIIIIISQEVSVAVEKNVVKAVESVAKSAKAVKSVGLVKVVRSANLVKAKSVLVVVEVRPWT